MYVRLAMSLTWGAALLVATLAGCGEEPPECYDGEYIACECEGDEGEAAGYQRCVDASYEACVCDGITPGVILVAPEGFLEPCDGDGDCATDLCHLFNAKGQLCSQPCENAGDCPPPSTGCNLMGICKAP